MRPTNFLRPVKMPAVSRVCTRTAKKMIVPHICKRTFIESIILSVNI